MLPVLFVDISFFQTIFYRFKHFIHLWISHQLIHRHRKWEMKGKSIWWKNKNRRDIFENFIKFKISTPVTCIFWDHRNTRGEWRTTAENRVVRNMNFGYLEFSHSFFRKWAMLTVEIVLFLTLEVDQREELSKSMKLKVRYSRTKTFKISARGTGAQVRGSPCKV